MFYFFHLFPNTHLGTKGISMKFVILTCFYEFKE
jgi:hypothetical protein